MLLKRIENEGEINSLYESSNIYGSKYKDGELTVIFKTGLAYMYEDVSKTEFIMFETADSQGKILNSKIKSKTFTKQDHFKLDIFNQMFENADKQDIENGKDLLWKVMDDMLIDHDYSKDRLIKLKETTEYLISLIK